MTIYFPLKSFDFSSEPSSKIVENEGIFFPIFKSIVYLLPGKWLYFFPRDPSLGNACRGILNHLLWYLCIERSRNKRIFAGLGLLDLSRIFF